MKILLFGGAGQLGFELLKRSRDLNFEMVAPVASEVDVANADQVGFIVERTKPAVIINSAAYTAVDKAEQEQDAAYRVNRDGARVVAQSALEAKARLIHISTDYVFDGAADKLLSETDPTNPQSVYGKSKLAGEQAIREVLNGEELIIRTSSLHGQRGENFVHTMLKLFNEREVVSVVNDQIMSPCWAGWLAEAILDLARAKATGTLHAACSGTASWFEFACAIHSWGKPESGDTWKARVAPMPMSELNRPAPRPKHSAFALNKITQLLGRAPMRWEDGLKNHLREIGRLKA